MEFSETVYKSFVCSEPIEESPMANKSTDEIVRAIKPKVEIEIIIKPVYNFSVNNAFID